MLFTNGEGGRLSKPSPFEFKANPSFFFRFNVFSIGQSFHPFPLFDRIKIRIEIKIIPYDWGRDVMKFLPRLSKISINSLVFWLVTARNTTFSRLQPENYYWVTKPKTAISRLGRYT